jgi:hypothetical protein
VADAVAWARGGDEREAFDRVLFKEVKDAVADCAFVYPFDSSPVRPFYIFPQYNIYMYLYLKVIHHVPLAEARSMWANVLQCRLKPGGQVLVITRPQQGTDYPFFDGARAAWAAAVPPDACLLGDLAAAGFENVTTDVKAFPCALPASKWLQMVRGRFWSTFDAFSDAELDAGLAEIRAAYVPPGARDDDHVLAFEDRLRFVTATKPYA